MLFSFNGFETFDHGWVFLHWLNLDALAILPLIADDFFVDFVYLGFGGVN